MVGDGPAWSHWLQMGYSGTRPFPHANLAAVASASECAHRSRPRRGGLCTKVAARPQQPTGHTVRSSETSEAAATAAKPDESLRRRRPARPPRPLRSLLAARCPLRLRSAPRPLPAPGLPGAAALAPCRSGGGTECRCLKPRATQPARCSTRSPILGCLKGPHLSQARPPRPSSSSSSFSSCFPLALHGQTATVALRTRDLAKVILREYMKNESQVPLNTWDHPVSILLVLSSCSRCAQPKQ